VQLIEVMKGSGYGSLHLVTSDDKVTIPQQKCTKKNDMSFVCTRKAIGKHYDLLFFEEGARQVCFFPSSMGVQFTNQFMAGLWDDPWIFGIPNPTMTP